MARASLRFASDLLRRLGEELTPSPVNGIIELVKNAYDADATACTVTFVQPRIVRGKLREYGRLTIEDNGDGMNLKDFRDGWLILGRSRKRADRPTRRGRRPVGDKGLGRLTALRLGRTVSVVSRPRGRGGREYTLNIDWKRFERSVTPNQVALDIRSKVAASNRPPGTTIVIDWIERPLSAVEMELLRRGLRLIANPFVAATDPFEVVLNVDDEAADIAMGEDAPLKAAQFILEGSVDARKRMQAKLLDGDGQVLAQADNAGLKARFKDASAKDLVPVRFRMWIYLLSSEHYPGGKKQYRDVRALLRAYGGTHVFVDNIRVVPYGDPGDDWVGMNAMRAASPELTPTTQSAIGYVALHAQPTLRQKTDRSGFLSSPTFAALREFVRASIRWQQSVRVSRRTVLEEDQARKHLKEVKRAVDDLTSVLKGLDEVNQAKANALVTKLIELGNAQQKRLRRELELYRTMGTAGIAASVFAHEAANNPLANLRGALESIRFKVDQGGSEKLQAAVAPVIDRGLQDVDGLESVAKITLALVKARNRRQLKLNVTEVIAGVLTIFKPYFTLHQVVVSPPKAQRAAIFGSRAALECILVNLLTNALQAFERHPPDVARIDIEVSSDGKLVEVDVSDSGPGIVGIGMMDMWNPGETTREEGTGLGLAIVRTAARDLGGKATARARSDLGGAGFTISLPQVPET